MLKRHPVLPVAATAWALRRLAAGPRAWRVGMWVGVALAVSSVDASAALRSTLTTSVGLFAALIAMLAVKASSAGVGSNQLLSASGAVLGVVAGASLLRRAWQRGGVARIRLSPAPGLVGLERSAALESAWCVPGACACLPGGVDRAQFLTDAKNHFVKLQAAWDLGDIGTLRALTSPNMLEELRCQLPERGAEPNRTDVVTLHAELLAFEEVGAAYLASVEFSGMIRERSDEGAAPFRELWMLARSKDGASDWQLARQQALL